MSTLREAYIRINGVGFTIPPQRITYKWVVIARQGMGKHIKWWLFSRHITRKAASKLARRYMNAYRCHLTYEVKEIFRVIPEKPRVVADVAPAAKCHKIKFKRT